VLGAEFFQVQGISFTPQSIVAAGGATLYLRFVEGGSAFLGTGANLWTVGLTGSAGGARFFVGGTGVDGALKAQWDDPTNGAVQVSTSADFVIGTPAEIRVPIFLDGGVWKFQPHWSINGAAEVAGSVGTIGASLPATWDEPDVTINSNHAGAGVGICHHREHKFVPGVKTLAEMRAA
jgi:hypothetical protein